MPYTATATSPRKAETTKLSNVNETADPTLCMNIAFTSETTLRRCSLDSRPSGTTLGKSLRDCQYMSRLPSAVNATVVAT